MSYQTFKSRKNNPDESDCLELEDYLQQIVNSLTQCFEHLAEGEATYKQFADVFEQSSTLEDVIKAISELTKILVRCLDSRVTGQSLRKVNSGLENREESFKGELELPSQDNYDGLEKLLQKYEAEIRDHIRIEQQLKIYSESLEEKVDDLEKSKSDFDHKIDLIKSENSKLRKEISLLKTEGLNFQAKIKQLRAKDLNKNQPRHSKSSSTEVVN